MGITESDIRDIQSKINPLLGKQSWGVRLGIGSFITFDFGERRIETKGKRQLVFGEWHLWVTYCAWRLEEDNNIIAGSEDDRTELKQKVKKLDGRTIQLIQLYPPALDTTIVFDGGMVLRLFSIYSKEYELWNLYTPDGNVLTIGPGTSWSYKSASGPNT